jgi:putative hemolysin
MLVSAVVILSLIVVVGLLNGAQVAFSEARRARMEEFSAVYPKRGALALSLMDRQEDVVAATRVATTLLVVATALFAGGPIVDEIVLWLHYRGVESWISETLAFGGVIASLSLCLAVLGELLPSRLARVYPEATARMMAPAVAAVMVAMSPLAKFAQGVVTLCTKPCGAPSEDEAAEELEEDIKDLVDEGQRAGVIEAGEKEIINRVFKLDDKPVACLMTPRADVVLLSQDDPVREGLALCANDNARHSWFPVRGESEDDILGIVSVYDLLALEFDPSRRGKSVRDILVQPVQVPVSMTALKLLELFRASSTQFAIVRDEYGGMAGVVTVYDVLQVMVGEFSDSHPEGRQIVERSDGSLLVDASTDVRELFERLGISDALPFSAGEFHSLGGFVMTTLGSVPREGIRFDAHGFTFEVVDMDFNRIDKVLVSSQVEQRKAAVS